MNTNDTTTELRNATTKNRRFILRNLTNGQRNAVKNGSIGIGGLTAGAGLFALFGPLEARPAQTDETLDISNPATSEPVVIYTDACFADSVSDDMNFGQAFGAAREEVGPGGFFEWRGNTYNTYYKDEWDQMTEEDHQEFYASVEQSADYEASEIAKSDSDDSSNKNDDIVEVEPVYGYTVDKDGYVDAVAMDSDHDGVADMIALDRKGDSNMDTLVIDVDLDDDMDVIIIDEGLDGFDKSDPVYDMGNVISMDEFIIIEDELDAETSNTADVDPSGYYPEIEPDLSNNDDELLEI